MPDTDEKAKAEKLAAARKRVAQLQKQKKKAEKKPAAEASKDAAPSTVPDAEGDKEHHDDEATAQDQPDDGPKDKSPEVAAQDAEEEGEDNQPTESTHRRRQPSLSVQSKMRSSAFRQTAAGGKSPPVPSLSPDGNSPPEIFKKQAMRLEELEKENKRLEKELQTADSRWKKTEEQLEDLREASGDVVELKEKLAQAEKKAEEVDKLKGEITVLQRQNTHLQTRTHRPSASISATGNSDSPSAALLSQLESKSAMVQTMELEISNLRAEIAAHAACQEQISALEEKLGRSETALQKVQRELTDTKHSLSRAAEKAVKEGVDKTSTETLIKSQERQLQEALDAKAEADKRIATLEKKLESLANLHKELEARNHTRLRERDKFEKDVAILRRKMVTIENENLRLKEDRDRVRKREAVGSGAEEGLDELEDEERARLERRVRQLEGENFDLRRGIWKEKKQELAAAGQTDDMDEYHPDSAGAGGAFDDVDLIGGPAGLEHSRRRSMAYRQQQHSSFATVISSGLAAFTGGGADQHRPSGFSEKHNDDFLEDDEFDEAAFAQAQAEEEARKRVEWAREIKSKLKDWKGWRLDLVESRYAAPGAAFGMGEVFEA